RCVAAVAGRAGDAAAGAEEARRLLRTAARLSGGQAARQTRLAVALADPGLAATAAALTAGRISPDQADALAQTARAHPELVAAARDELVAQAAGTDDWAFRQALADRRHAADPRPEEQRACRQYAARRVSVSELAGGMTRIEGLLDPVGGALVRTAIDALAGPDPATVPDEPRRALAQRNADALVQLARMALAHRGDLPTVAGLQPTATVFVTPETLAEEPDAPAARLDWAGTVCGATARRMACDADVVRRQVTRRGRTVWVDVRRHPSPAQRLAVIERDRTCRFTGSDGVRCERPWQWCDVHRPCRPPPPTHPKRIDGGPTALPDLSLLCVAHHHLVHEGGWTITGDANHMLVFHPPAGRPHQPRPPRPARPARAGRPAARPDSGHRQQGRRGRDRDPPQPVLTE
ncbi:MAG: DUF222 domain-containing protein, partial [Egibacteraceae bacterium]